MKEAITGFRILGFKRSVELIIISLITYFYGVFYIIKTSGIKGYNNYKKKFEDEFVRLLIEVYTKPYLSRMNPVEKIRFVKANI